MEEVRVGRLVTITCWCGGQEYADMTEAMLGDLSTSIEAWGGGTLLSITKQGVPAGTMMRYPLFAGEEQTLERNGGFAVGMNLALKGALERLRSVASPPDALLCLNNDIRMPDRNWLKILIDELEPDVICCPTTNYTSVNEQRATAPQDRDPFQHVVTPGLCWLIPWPIVELIRDHLDGKLFPEDLGGRCWGEDNYVAGVVRHKVRPDPFKIVPRSWIHHLGAKTSSKIPADERMRAHKEAQARMKREFS